MLKHPFTSAVIAAAGASTRMGQDKQFLLIQNKPVLSYSIQAMYDCPLVDEIIIVTSPQAAHKVQALVEKMALNKPVKLALGGASRQQSVKNGADATDPKCQFLCVHDGARPCAAQKDIQAVIQAAYTCKAATLGVNSKDTIKQADEAGFVQATPAREGLFCIQTPQVMDKALYLKGYAHACKQGLTFTDDCQLFELLGLPVQIVQGSYQNIKITTSEDIAFLQNTYFQEESSMRIGHGYDVHRLTSNRKLILGGVQIPHETGLLGHSDADVLLHAIMDAILGALGLGDIGLHFPDTDERYKGADSLELLGRVYTLMQQAGWQVGNIDATILAQAPKLRPYIQNMQENIANTLHTIAENVNIKATTEEGLGFTGAKQGMAAHAVCVLVKTRTSAQLPA